MRHDRSRLAVFDRRKWLYLIEGALGHFTQRRLCPCCGCSHSDWIERKYFYSLRRCLRCRILFRFPVDSPAKLMKFYQHEYAESGLTTELPTVHDLNNLLVNSFKGSEKDFSRIISILQCLGLRSGSRVLDYGANWGYGTWQLRQAGFDAAGFEISRPRAQYAERLGIQLTTSEENISGLFDAVYSGHVLEHVDNPLAVLRKQLALTAPGGFVIGHTPNGSEHRRRVDPVGFRLNWGQVHPFMITEEFIASNFDTPPLFVSSTESLDELQKWDHNSQSLGNLTGSELFFVIRNTGQTGRMSDTGRRQILV